MRTYTPKPGDVTKQWHVIDATDVVLGRLASQVATLLRGKHKASFAPHVDGGDFVIVINASKVALTGAKATDKLVHRHSGFPVGFTRCPLVSCWSVTHRVIENAVKGMLPHTKLGAAQLKNLKVYAGPEHPHAAQQPQAFEISQVAQ